MSQLEQVVLAAKEGRISELQQMIAAAPDSETKQQLAGKALKIASYWGHVTLVRWLIANGADVNHSDSTGDTSLMSAARKARTEIAGILLRAGANPNARDHGGATALMGLARTEGMAKEKNQGYLELGKLLLESGADSNLVDNHGCTALICSLFDQRIEFIRLLLGFGADPNIGPLEAGTAMEIAERRGYQEIVRLFVDSSQSPTTHLLRAAREGDLDALVKALEAGAYSNCTSSTNWTPLLEASIHHADLVHALLAAGADPNRATPEGYTPLMRAAGHGNDDVVKLLLAGGAEITARDHLGQTALDMAVAEGKVETTRLLEEATRSASSPREGADTSATRRPAPASDIPLRVQPIFITSTFRDMHAERDHLRQVVLPALEENLLDRRIQVELIDLRWGVDTADADEQVRRLEQILKVCFQEVERSRPYLIALLGDRYGWVPPAERIQDATREAGVEEDWSGRSLTELEILFGLKGSDSAAGCLLYLRNALPYDELLASGSMDPATAAEYSDWHRQGPDTESARASLSSLKRRLRTEHPDLVREYCVKWDPQTQSMRGLDTWSIEGDLFSLLSAQTAPEAKATGADWRKRERREIDEFCKREASRLVCRECELEELVRHAKGEGLPWGLCLLGDPGIGKSALLGALSARLAGEEVLCLTHFAGLTPRSRSIPSMLVRWGDELVTAIGSRLELPDEAEMERVVHTFWSLVREVAVYQHIVLVVDALEKFDEPVEDRALCWLTATWPSNVRLVTSSSGPIARLLERRGVAQIPIGPIEEPQRRQIILQVCDRYHRVLPLAVEKLLLTKEITPDVSAAGSPRWLRVATEELNLIDRDDFVRAESEFPGTLDGGLPALLGSLVFEMPDQLPELYRWIILRSARRLPFPEVRSFLSVLALGRQGFRERDLRALLPRLSQQEWNETRFAMIRRLFRAHITQRGELATWDFIDSGFRSAVLTELLPREMDRRLIHHTIAHHLLDVDSNDSLRAEELFYHLIAAEETEALVREVLEAFAAADSGSNGLPLRGAFLAIAAQLRRLKGGGVDWLLGLLDLSALTERELLLLAGLIQQDVLPFLENDLPLDTRTDITIGVQRRLKQCREKDSDDYLRVLEIGHNRLGNMLLQQGQGEAALEEFRHALALAERLVKRHPSSPVFVNDLAVAYDKIGRALLELHRKEESRAALEQALTLTRRCVSIEPSGANLLSVVIGCQQLGTACLTLRDVAGAREQFEEALTFGQRIGGDLPRAVRDKSRSISLEHLGDIAIREHHPEKGLEFYREARRLRERVVAASVSSSEAQTHLAIILKKCADAKLELGNPSEATADYQAAHARFEELLRSDPRNLEWRLWQARVLRDLAEALAAESLPRAVEATHVAIDYVKQVIAEFTGDLDGRRVFLTALLQLGDLATKQEGGGETAQRAYGDAIAMAQDIVNIVPADATARRDLAVAHGKLGGALYRQEDWQNSRPLLISAFELTEKCLAELPNDRNLSRNRIGYLFMRAVCDRKLGDEGEALNAAERCRELLSSYVANGWILDAQLERIRASLQREVRQHSRFRAESFKGAAVEPPNDLRGESHREEVGQNMKSARRAEALERMDQDLRDYDSEIGLFHGDRFPFKLGEAILSYIVGAADLGSKLPVLFFRDAVARHPASGLAWYGLSMAISNCDRAGSEEALAALGKALELGCGYIEIKDGSVVLSAFDDEDDE